MDHDRPPCQVRLIGPFKRSTFVPWQAVRLGPKGCPAEFIPIKFGVRRQVEMTGTDCPVVDAFKVIPNEVAHDILDGLWVNRLWPILGVVLYPGRALGERGQFPPRTVQPRSRSSAGCGPLHFFPFKMTLPSFVGNDDRLTATGPLTRRLSCPCVKCWGGCLGV